MNFKSGSILIGALLLTACSSDHAPPPPSAPSPPPFYIQGGAGSEHGNFESYQEGGTIGPDGLECVTYVWDRPLDNKTALRLRSQSCQDPQNPHFYKAEELERKIIPLTSSTLFQGAPN